ncbi:PilW family protein [Neisseria montereyensis]|uniref:Pilus assembly protein PilW n=1 Tax=Neisseria montereyensis TaxID=2973938 RepID=A0ABT2FBF0_9NEIS|nr:hypothetical protein [Neisseria montereyensis]MCS4533447.1 hypothetical protein [Neisseria montereyensis]
MKTNNNNFYITAASKPKGFSLIEFAVASLLSMIVLMAVSKGYFTARQLNTAASERLIVQQDLRNAANMIVRDARMAGNFGCFNMMAETEIVPKTVGGKSMATVQAKVGGRRIIDNNATTAASDAFKLINDSNNLLAIRSISRSNFSPSGFNPGSDALIFMYGTGNGRIGGLDNEVDDGAPLIFSSCDALVRPADDTMPTDNTVRNALGASADDSEITVMNYIVNAYVTGNINGQQGLYRFQLTNDNNWGNPQLLVKDITDARLKYLYIDNCPEEVVPESADSFEKFEYSDSLSRMPALVRMTFSGGVQDANQIYTIDAAVRGGNTCANRTL